MDFSIFIFFLFALQTLYWLVGRYSSQNMTSQADYFLAKKNVGFFPLMMTFLAVEVGGGVVLGAAEEAYKFGWPVFFYPLGGALGLIILGFGIGGRLHAFNVTTIAQIFEKVYGSSTLKKIASLLSAISLFMVLAVQIMASHKFLVSLGFDNTWLFIFFWTVVILYTAQGGLRAVISTDVVQAAFFCLVFLGTFLFILFHEQKTIFLPMPEIKGLSSVSSKLLGWLLMPPLFVVTVQDMGQRCFAGVSSKVVSKATFIAGILALLVGFIPVFIGVLARSAEIEVVQGGSVLMAAVIELTNPFISALVGCAVLAAIISSATSLINGIGANLASDFSHPFSQNLRFIKGMSSLISFGAILVAFSFNNIVDLLIQSYEFSVVCLFVPIFIALYKKQGNPLSAWLAIVGGAIGFILFRFFSAPVPQEIASISLSCTGFVFGELATYYKNYLEKKNDDLASAKN